MYKHIKTSKLYRFSGVSRRPEVKRAGVMTGGGGGGNVVMVVAAT